MGKFGELLKSFQGTRLGLAVTILAGIGHSEGWLNPLGAALVAGGGAVYVLAIAYRDAHAEE
jgi:hypothetical protein